jgi:hypothetical protein
MAPAAKYVVTPNRVSQLEGQKQGTIRFSFTGAHDILERTTKNIGQWIKLRFALWHWLSSISNVFKTCHDAADTEADGKIKEHRRSGKINAVAHEVYGPGNQLNADAEGGNPSNSGPARDDTRMAHGPGSVEAASPTVVTNDDLACDLWVHTCSPSTTPSSPQQPRNQPTPGRTKFGDGTFLAGVGVALGVVLGVVLETENALRWGLGLISGEGEQRAASIVRSL